MLSLPVALGVLAGTLACLGGIGFIVGGLIALYLDERDARREVR
jgi:hypothetical protein